MTLPRALLGSVFAIAALACAPPRPAVVDIAPAVSGAHAGDSAEAPDEPAARTGPGCSWTGRILHGRGDALPLCFAADGACFGRVPAPLYGRVSLSLPEGKPEDTGAHLDIAADGVRIDAWTAGAEPLLYPNTPIVLGGVAVARGGASLRVDRVGHRFVELALDGSGLRALKGTLRARAACTDVALDGSGLSEETIRSVIGKLAREAQGDHTFVSGQVVSISEQPDGPDIAEVTVEEDYDTTVELLSQRGARSRVLWWRADAVFFGWVDTAALHPPPPPATGALGASGTGGLGIAGPSRPGTRCPADVPLFAEVLGTKLPVGAIEKGTRFDVLDKPAETNRVRLRTRAFELEDNARWFVPSAALDGCVLD